GVGGRGRADHGRPRRGGPLRRGGYVPRLRRAARRERGAAGGLPRRPRRGAGRGTGPDAAARRRRPRLPAGQCDVAAGTGRAARPVGQGRGAAADAARGGLDRPGSTAGRLAERAVAAGGPGAVGPGRGERWGGTVISGRARLAICAWAATLMAACALVPLVDKATWLVQSTLLLAVQSGVGAAARRGPLARPLTVAAQLAV